MTERYTIKSAVMLFLLRETNNTKEILLQKRQNTGYADGMWDCAASGHVEKGESLKMAMIREAKEEINIDIKINNIHFATLTHKYILKSDSCYMNAYFAVTIYSDIPIINEPEKCSDLQWFNINNLPNDFLEDRKEALNNYLLNIPYSELHWEETLNTR